jgi:Na+-transporting methylmalonyl-CoA/oxaloacetate decarboxylase gamma subunit
VIDWGEAAKIAGAGIGIVAIILIVVATATWIAGILLQKIEGRPKRKSSR